MPINFESKFSGLVIEVKIWIIDHDEGLELTLIILKNNALGLQIIPLRNNFISPILQLNICHNPRFGFLEIVIYNQGTIRPLRNRTSRSKNSGLLRRNFLSDNHEDALAKLIIHFLICETGSCILLFTCDDQLSNLLSCSLFNRIRSNSIIDYGDINDIIVTSEHCQSSRWRPRIRWRRRLKRLYIYWWRSIIFTDCIGTAEEIECGGSIGNSWLFSSLLICLNGLLCGHLGCLLSFIGRFGIVFGGCILDVIN